jgi:hypothetical protein
MMVGQGFENGDGGAWWRWRGGSVWRVEGGRAFFWFLGVGGWVVWLISVAFQ